MLSQILLDIILTVSIVLIIIYLILKKYTRFRLYHTFSMDDILITKEADSLPGKSTVYATSKALSSYIKKYVIARNGDENLLIVNYSRPLNSISYFVVGYDKSKKVTEVIEVIENETSTTSKIVGLKKKTQYVNIVLKEAEKVTVNSQVIKPMKRKEIRMYAFLISLVIFLALFLVQDLTILLFFRRFRYGFVHSTYSVILLASYFVVSLLSYIFLTISLKKRNIKMRSGGILEYEFF